MPFAYKLFRLCSGMNISIVDLISISHSYIKPTLDILASFQDHYHWLYRIDLEKFPDKRTHFKDMT